MKNCIVLIVVLFSLANLGFGQDKPAQLNDLKDKASYSIGLNIGRNFKKQNVELNPDALLAGVKDSLAGRSAV